MTTPEEQKATLHANRLARPVSPTPSPSPANASTQPHDRRSALQSSRFRAFSIATALPLTPSPSNQTSQQEETLQSDDSQEEETVQQTQAQQSQHLAGIQAGINAQTQQQAQNQKTKQPDEETQQQQEEVKKVAKAAMHRGLMFIINGLSSALAVGSAGIGFIITCLFQLFSLGILNLQMIYGKYFAKGKSRWIASLSWDPLPMPIDKDAIILSGFVVAADIALGVAFLVLFFGGFCIIHDFAKVTSSVTEAGLIGASLAQGKSGGLCLGGIITSAFGL